MEELQRVNVKFLNRLQIAYFSYNNLTTSRKILSELLFMGYDQADLVMGLLTGRTSKKNKPAIIRQDSGHTNIN